MVIIDDNGIRYDSYTNDTQLTICSMEYIYFARPDSDIYGVNVHTARKNMGKRLAQEFIMKLISLLGCQIHHFQQPWDSLKNQVFLMKWAW